MVYLCHMVKLQCAGAPLSYIEPQSRPGGVLLLTQKVCPYFCSPRRRSGAYSYILSAVSAENTARYFNVVGPSPWPLPGRSAAQTPQSRQSLAKPAGVGFQRTSIPGLYGRPLGESAPASARQLRAPTFSRCFQRGADQEVRVDRRTARICLSIRGSFVWPGDFLLPDKDPVDGKTPIALL